MSPDDNQALCSECQGQIHGERRLALPGAITCSHGCSMERRRRLHNARRARREKEVKK